jgi:hypothetical protein
MARKLLKDTCDTAAAILDGSLDGDLEWIEQAIRARRKAMFRVGSRVRLHGTRNPNMEGKEGVVMRVNAKRVTVGIGTRDQFGYENELLVPTTMLEVI